MEVIQGIIYGTITKGDTKKSRQWLKWYWDPQCDRSYIPYLRGITGFLGRMRWESSGLSQVRGVGSLGVSGEDIVVIPNPKP